MESQQVKQRIFLQILWLAGSAILFGLLLDWFVAAAAGSEQPPQTAVSQLQVNSEGLQFTLQTAPAMLDSAHPVEVPGLNDWTQTAGAPQLPAFSKLVLLPPGAEITAVSVQAGHVVEQPLSAVTPAPRGRARRADNSLVSPVVTPSYSTEAAVYQQNRFYPESSYRLSAPMMLRDLRVVRLTLYPLRYNPVQQRLSHSRALHVSLKFSTPSVQPAGGARSSSAAAAMATLAPQLLNPGQLHRWRGQPAVTAGQPAVTLPTGQDVYKISLNEDGIYEISYAELAAAGMAVSQVDPATLQMSYRGQPVAYEWLGDGDSQFEAGEKLRFYGWAFTGSRLEKQYISDNVLWLWADGSASRISSVSHQAGLPLASSTVATITTEPEFYYFSTWTDQWDSFPNEPDAWYWDYLVKSSEDPLTQSYGIELPTPDLTSGTVATVTVELFSRNDSATHIVSSRINSSGSSSATWTGKQSVNISDTVPVADLLDGSNNVQLVVETAALDELYLNRITVAYLRELTAVNNQLIFHDEVGNRQFEVQGFSEGDLNQIIAWEISDPTQPTAVNGIVSAAPNGYRFGTSHNAGAEFIITTASNVKTAAISRYVPPSLTPENGADWIAISHSSLLTEANRLANHRAGSSGLSTHVVDVADVINQYGFGLPLPAAINSYLSEALAGWAVAPQFVTLVGDATLNPRQLDCLGGCFAWDAAQPTLVPTHLLFVDRFQGYVPSDHAFVLLSGNDLLADMAIGRLAVETAVEAANLIDKIILREQQLANGQDPHHLLFVSDDEDPFAGDFCAENAATGALLADFLLQTHLCLIPSGSTPTQEETDALRVQMFTEVNGTGVSILNYRGHGAIEQWASPAILSTDMTDFWNNPAFPAIILSADCLDGHFAWPGATALSETYLRLEDVGTAAHWSSSGLGFTFEHTALHNGFYEGLFTARLATVGEAANYAKTSYHSLSFHESELYTFTLQGDPAMPVLYQPLYLPVVIKP